MEKRLRSQARYVGKGQAPGRLYDMGWYPAAFFDEREKNCVHGDVFALKPGARLLAELDAYEFGDPNYVRSPLRVRLSDGREVVTWRTVLPGRRMLGLSRTGTLSLIGAERSAAREVLEAS